MKPVTVGDVTITSLVERDGPWRRPEDMFPGFRREDHPDSMARLAPEAMDEATGKMAITYQSFVVRTPDAVILVDTCTGEDKGYAAPMDFPKTPWLRALAAEGLAPEDVDIVFCTHLHIDHSGWNTKLEDGRWVPFFPRARYVFHKAEVEAWAALDAAGEERPGGAGGVFRMNVKPILEAGRAILAEDGHEIAPGLALRLTPGHSPGHCCLDIRRGGQRAVITGDLFHHQLQCHDPELSTIFCWDAQAARDSRRAVFEEVADTEALVLPIHFPAPTAGRLSRAAGGGYDWAYRRD